MIKGKGNILRPDEKQKVKIGNKTIWKPEVRKLKYKQLGGKNSCGHN